MRHAIIIPALNPPKKLISLTESLIKRGAPQIIVINDGSQKEYRDIFAQVAKIPGCEVVYHESNRGKGRALKTGFQHFLQNSNPTLAGIITVDADGQHTIDDICNITAYAAAHPDEFILGVRKFKLGETPWPSYWGNKIISTLFALRSGKYITDTQTGLRVIPRRELVWMTALRGEGYDFEINMLMQALRRHLKTSGYPIQTVYFDHNRMSHFRACRDSLVILHRLISG